MKPKILAALFAMLLFSGTAIYAAPLGEKDLDVLMERAAAFSNAFNTGDAKSYVGMMHPAIKVLGISREEMFLVVQDSMQEMPRLGIVLEKVSFERPHQCYEASKETICFVPRQMIIRTQGLRQLYRGYLLAGRNSRGPFDWHFLDSDAFRKNPERISQLFPALPQGIKIPPIRAEPLP